MTLTPMHLLAYSGPVPQRQVSAPMRAGRTTLALLWLLFRIVLVVARVALLASGLVLVAGGTLLLGVGGRRDAARRTRAAFDRTIDLVGLWASDMIRPVRRWHRSRHEHRGAAPVIPLVVLPEAGR